MVTNIDLINHTYIYFASSVSVHNINIYSYYISHTDILYNTVGLFMQSLKALGHDIRADCLL